MKPSLAELIDRYSIEWRKNYYGAPNSEFLAELRGAIYEIMGGAAAEAVFVAAEVGIINDGIACLEWQIRAGAQLSDAEIGRRARLTRILNDKRSEIKARLDAREFRVFGYGAQLDAKDLTLDVQEPRPVAGCSPVGAHG